MIALTSTWKLKNGLPPELETTLKNLAAKVSQEPGTLLYIVNIPAPAPLDDKFEPLDPPPPPIPPAEQQQIEFLEVYRDAAAFSTHIKGPVFSEFLRDNIQYFKEVPGSSGQPDTVTVFLDPQSATAKPCLDDSPG